MWPTQADIKLTITVSLNYILAFEVRVALIWQAPKLLFPEQTLLLIQESKIERTSASMLSESGLQQLTGGGESKLERSEVLSPLRRHPTTLRGERDILSFFYFVDEVPFPPPPSAQVADHEYGLEWWME